MLRKLEILLHVAVDNGWRKDDPTLRIKKFAEGEFHTWTDEEIAVFENEVAAEYAGAQGLRLAALYGAARLGRGLDVLGGYRGGWRLGRAAKTKAKLLIPVHPALRAALESCPTKDGTLLKTAYDVPLTSKGF